MREAFENDKNDRHVNRDITTQYTTHAHCHALLEHYATAQIWAYFRLKSFLALCLNGDS